MAAAPHPAEVSPHGGRSELWRIMSKSYLALLKCRFRYRTKQLENVRGCVLLSLGISRLHFFWICFSMKTSVPTIPRQLKS